MLTKREKVILNGPQEMLLSFVPPQLKKKKTRACKWRARGKSCRDRKDSSCCVLTLPLHLIVKESSHSYHFLWDGLYQHWALLSLPEHPCSTLTKMQIWLLNPYSEIGAQADREEEAGRGKKGNKKLKPTMNILARSFPSISLTT